MKNRTKIIIGAISLLAVYVIYVALPRPIPNEVLKSSDSNLTGKSAEITVFDEDVQQISKELHQILKKVDIYGSIFGLGLAAPQIGYKERIIAIKESYGDYKTMINPEIIERKWRFPWIEGCFSLEGIHLTQRYFWTKVRYQDLDGNYHEELAEKIIQQEIDHLDGILITDY